MAAAASLYDPSVKGDRVEVVIDTGGAAQTYEIAATRAGRRVEVSTARGVVEVSEVTRSGQPVRSGRFMAARVIALVEHPAADGPRASGAGSEPGPQRRRARTEQRETLL
jgi:hypothetical protein